MKTFFQRELNLSKDLKNRSILLLGPRRTGKSKLIEKTLKPDFSYDLLQADTFRELSANPERIRQRLNGQSKLVVIDEIQKLPFLMDEIHSMIEKTSVRFLLTGSSARKLKQSYTSLMAGRARLKRLFPLTYSELNNSFDLTQVLNIGTLPSIYLSNEPKQDLKDYVGLYLKEEVMAEALVRKIDNFSRFLTFAGLSNGQILNFESLGSDAQVPSRTVREYYSILTDTLIGYMLEPMRSSVKRKSTATSKFYFFDIGVVNTLTGRTNLIEKTREYGDALEHFIFLELIAYKNYHNKDDQIQFWNSPQEGEIDFVINAEIAIEVKSTTNVNSNHISGFKKFEVYEKAKRKILICQEKFPRKIERVEVQPVIYFLQQLWAGEIF